MPGRVQDKVVLVTGAGSVGPGWGNGKASAVLNVGILASGGPVELSEADWDRVVAVNQTSMFLTCKHGIPHMLRQGGGAIVNIASIAGIRWLGIPYVVYTTTKGAVISFTMSVAMQYAKQGIRANCVLPGLMNTPMIREPLKEHYGGDIDAMLRARSEASPTGAMGDAWDVAHAALFLASDEARYVTATQIVVDGGLTAKGV